MTFRAALMKSMNKKMSELLRGGSRSIGGRPASIPKMKAYASTTGEEGMSHKGKARATYTPVYVALGMISFAVVLGLHTAKQQFMHAPAVLVKKSRRETVPEVVEPERVAQESENFIKKSLFRKVAHVQEFQTPLDDPIHGNPLVKKVKKEGISPKGCI